MLVVRRGVAHHPRIRLGGDACAQLVAGGVARRVGFAVSVGVEVDGQVHADRRAERRARQRRHDAQRAQRGVRGSVRRDAQPTQSFNWGRLDAVERRNYKFDLRGRGPRHGGGPLRVPLSFPLSVQRRDQIEVSYKVVDAYT